MKKPEVRPHFELTVSVSTDEAIRRLRKAVAQQAHHIEGDVVGEQCYLTVSKHHRHLYSPFLTFEIAADPKGSRLVGRFMPQMGIWSLYITLYGALTMVTVGMGIFGLVQRQLGMPAWALWAVPIGVAALGSLYASAFVGQRLGAGQMAELNAFVDAALRVDEPE